MLDPPEAQFVYVPCAVRSNVRSGNVNGREMSGSTSCDLAAALAAMLKLKRSSAINQRGIGIWRVIPSHARTCRGGVHRDLP